jgi:alpha-L-rhamnosidase
MTSLIFKNPLRPIDFLTLILAMTTTQATTAIAGTAHVDWQSEWIHMEGQDRSAEAPAPFLRRTFTLAQPVREATIHATALGWYRLYINGKRVGNAELLPGWTDYRKRVPYHSFDVSGHVREGENGIGAMLGDGWYSGRMGWRGNKQFYGDHPELLVQLEVTYADGSTEILGTDDKWKTSEGPIREDDFYDGEVYDARMEMPGWNLPGFDDSNWQPIATRPLDPAVIIEPARHAPVRAMEELPTRELWEAEPGRWVFDLGQNIVGWPRIKVPGEEGQVITIRFAEMLEKDRTLYTANYRGAKSTDTYIGKGGSAFETWEPTFTFHGFRYVELSGFSGPVKPEAGWVTGIVLYSELEQTGHFACSNGDLNQLQSNIVWGQKGNFLDVPTDCPQRDERMGWTGDAQVFCPTACFNFDTLAFFRKWMTDMRDAQREDGAFPHVAPQVLPPGRYDSPAWADAGVVVPWEVFVRFGDTAILEENLDAMIRWVAYQEANSPGLVRPEIGFGDWLQPYPKGDGNRGDTSRSLIGTAYFARTAELTARAARVVDRTEDADRMEDLAGRVRLAFGNAFWKEGRLSSDAQTAHLLALAFDLLPEENRPVAFARLLELIEEADGHLRTGFVGTPLLAPVLTRFGRVDLAYDILLKETYPGWIFSIRQGATTMWERWNSYSHADGFGDAGMNSFNHYAYGAIGQWMYETVAGLVPDPAKPGYQHFFIQPQPGGGLTWAEATLDTKYGPAVSSWRMEEDALVMEATVPEGTAATVVFPSGSPDDISHGGSPIGDKAEVIDGRTRLSIGPGQHRFTVLP